MEDFRDGIKYWAIVVIWPAIKAAIPISELGGRIKDILVSLILAIPAVILLGNVSQIQGIGANVPPVLAWLGVTVIIRFVFGLMYFPFKAYKDIGGISENPLKLTARPSEKSESGAWVVMDVHCKSGFGVRDCVLTLKEAIDIKTKKSILRSSERLTWSGRSQRLGIKDVPDRPGNSLMPIQGMGHEYCDIAQTVKNNLQAKFTLWHNDNQYIPPGEYEITIEVNGVWEKEPRMGFAAESNFILTYNSGDDLSIRGVGMTRIEK